MYIFAMYTYINEFCRILVKVHIQDTPELFLAYIYSLIHYSLDVFY